MTRGIRTFLYLIAVACAVPATAQVGLKRSYQGVQNSTQPAPVALVYVSSYVGGKTGEIYIFSAAANGRLTLVQELPLPAAVWGMAPSKKYLFTTDTTWIYSFSVANDGTIKQVSSVNAVSFNKRDCGSVSTLFLDRAGAALYDFDQNFDCNDNDAYQFFTVDPSTGDLAYLGTTNTSNDWWNGPVNFIGSDHYGYQAHCIGDEYWTIYGFRRTDDGTLTELDRSFPTPAPKYGDFYCPNLASADPTDHIAISVQAVNGNFGNDGPPQLATYTADASGRLTTRSTYRNMPSTAETYVYDMAASPSGELLAVGGDAGLQVFHFNGGKPITVYTGLLTQGQISQLFWDKDNHLYAIGSESGKLFVFTVTPSSFRQAPGSPYTITTPQFISVLSKTKL